MKELAYCGISTLLQVVDTLFPDAPDIMVMWAPPRSFLERLLMIRPQSIAMQNLEGEKAKIIVQIAADLPMGEAFKLVHYHVTRSLNAWLHTTDEGRKNVQRLLHVPKELQETGCVLTERLFYTVDKFYTEKMERRGQELRDAGYPVTYA